MSSFSQCPRCHTPNATDAYFCARCGLQLQQQSIPIPTGPAKRSNSLIISLGVVLGLFGLCGLFGLIGRLNKNSTNLNLGNSNKPTSTAEPSAASTPTPRLTFAELEQRSEPLLALQKEEFAEEDLRDFDAVIQPLREIPKEAKEYRQAQALMTKLINKAARITAEMLVLGPKPKNSEWDGRVDAVVDYLRNNLNDYDSSEFVEWSPVTKLEVKGEPFWVVRLKLRAKNAFGGYLLKNTFYFIRQNKVVTAEGL
jgi:hypothetical protein